MPDTAIDVRQRVRELLVDLLGGDNLVNRVSDSESLRKAGVSSTALVSLLVAMEDAFGFEWDDEVQPEVLRSIGSLSDHVVTVSN